MVVPSDVTVETAKTALATWLLKTMARIHIFSWVPLQIATFSYSPG